MRDLESLSSYEQKVEKEHPLGNVIHLINTRVWMSSLRFRSSSIATISETPDEILERQFGHADVVWFMGFYKPSEAARANALRYAHEYIHALPDLQEEDIDASPYAIYSYEPNPFFCQDWKEFDAFREKLKQKGKRYCLILFQTMSR